MKAHFEKVISGSSSFIVFERVASSFPFYWHYHPELELTLIVEGQGQRLVGDSMADYRAGDLVLLGPSLPHTWSSRPAKHEAHERHRAIVVQFRQEFLGADFFDLPEMSEILTLLQRSEVGLAFEEASSKQRAISILLTLPGLPPPRRITALLDVLAILSMEAQPVPLSSNPLHPVCSVTERRRVDSICSYLRRNLGETLNYAQLAGYVHMEQASLCRFFKRATGRTITRYLNELRVSEAGRLLSETDESLLKIGLEVGFGNYSNFNRQFRSIRGMSPRDFRRHIQEQLAEEIPVASSEIRE